MNVIAINPLSLPSLPLFRAPSLLGTILKSRYGLRFGEESAFARFIDLKSITSKPLLYKRFARLPEAVMWLEAEFPALQEAITL
jgi:hypothetical protein